MPAFISPEHPTTSVTIFTNDTSFSQLTFTIKFKAALDSDPAISDEFTFEVSLQCDVFQIGITQMMTSSIFTYLVEPASPSLMRIAMPVYEAIPACANNFSFSLNPATTGVSIAGGNIVVQTGDFSAIGTHLIQISVVELFSGLSNNEVSFTLVIRCASVLTFGFTSALTDMSYSITTPKLTQPMPTYQVTPAVCSPDIDFLLVNLDSVPTPFMGPLAAAAGI